jgi:hypothetical protein
MDNSPYIQYWDLPDQWLNNLIKKFEIKIEVQEKTIKIPYQEWVKIDAEKDVAEMQNKLESLVIKPEEFPSLPAPLVEATSTVTSEPEEKKGAWSV